MTLLLPILIGSCSIPLSESDGEILFGVEVNIGDITATPPHPILPSATMTPIPTATSSSTPIPTPTPTVTPSPTSTPIPYFEGPIIIGHSVAGRPLEVFRFGIGPRKRMIIAGIHGGYEWNTIALADQLISILREEPDRIPDEITLYILRALNPDGEARSHGIHGRTNENGVDLNRNWPAFWQPTWPLNGCWSYLPVSAGDFPASEPETDALMGFLLDHQIEALLNYHSAALGIFAGGQPPDPASVSLAEAVAAVSNYPYPPLDLGCKYTGQLIDWASEYGIAALDIELTNHTDTDLLQNLEILTVFLEWQP
ncbi:MAG: M14 family metallopeptidase [Anaerolineales bacterium]